MADLLDVTRASVGTTVEMQDRKTAILTSLYERNLGLESMMSMIKLISGNTATV